MTDTVSDLRERSGQFRKTDYGAICDAIRRVRGRSGFRDHSTRREIAHPRSGVYRDEAKRKPKMHLRFESGVGSGFKISLCWRQLLLITIVCCVVRLHCGLPIFGIVFCPGQFSVMCGVAERGSSQCAHFEIILRRLEGWRPEQVTWFLAIPYLPKLMR